MKLHFKHDNHVTKRTFRFEEVDEEGVSKEREEQIIGKIYIKKKIFDSDEPPKNISVEISWEE